MQVDMVSNITFVDGTGKAHTVPRDGLEGRGLAGGLGMLGVITEVTLRLQPGLGKTRVWAIGPKSDDGIEQEMRNLIVSGCAAADVTTRETLLLDSTAVSDGQAQPQCYGSGRQLSL
jgi:FAD/FMN-containing dehydrogenase